MNPSSIFLSFILIILSPLLVSSQTCQKTCGNIPIKYPFGTGPGCGDPRFQPYVTCNQQQQLTFTSHTGCYPVTSIDYINQVIYISDPTMSTCACTQPSKGFGLNWDAPFTFHDNTVFALLDCSNDSLIYRGGNNSTSTYPMCDSEGSSICSTLYSCDSITRLSLPVSSCCVYTPVDLGPSFEMDLQKLHCSSYSALYGFNGETDPRGWKYGVALKYKFNFNNDYPALCASCERSNGVCGFNYKPYQSFACNCPGVNGINTTTDCFFGWSHSTRFLPWRTGTILIFSITGFVLLTLM